jgi:mannosyl-3-phosphoglycerate phosphatase
LRCVRGGRFNHLLGAGDKGRACRYLIECFRRELSSHGGTLETIGIGDSLNDCSMLANVDRPILVQKPDGSYDSEIRVPRLVRAPGIGPIGWNRAVLSLLRAE